MNVENLFDEENAVALGRRTDKVFRAIKNDVAGWTHWSLRSVQLEDALVEVAERFAGDGPVYGDSNWPPLREGQWFPKWPRSVGCGSVLKLTWTTSRVA